MRVFDRLTSLLIVFVTISLVSLMLTGCNESTYTEAQLTDIAANLTDFMTAYNQNHSYGYSGAILVAKGDKILLNEGYGIADYGDDRPNTTDSVFPIGSITKSMTAIGIMQLQEKGLLNVDDPISNYIEGHIRAEDITIHQLLCHTSGLPLEGLFLGKQQVSLADNVDYINETGLLFEPGQDHAYSNAGYQMLAAIIEQVSGMTYNDYIRDNVLIPLEMDTSRGGVDDSYGEKQSIGYRITPNDTQQLSIYNFSCITGSGNMYSTVEDLYKYYRATSNESLVTTKSLADIFSHHWGSLSNGYGYGWFISERYGHKKLSHGGCIGNGGYNSLIIKYPDDDFVLIFLTNNDDTTALDAVSESFEAIIFGEEYVIPEEATPIKIDSEVLEEYAGDYLFGRSFILSVNYKEGKLYSTADDGNLYGLIPLSETRFHYQDHQCIQGEFIRGKDGMIYRLRSRSRVAEGEKIEN